MSKKVLCWEDYCSQIQHRRKNVFKSNEVFYIDKGHFITYIVLLCVSLGTIVSCFFINSDVTRNSLICIATGLFSSILISSIVEIINNKASIKKSVAEFNNYLFQIYTYTAELINVSNVEDSLIEREARSRYNKKYGASSEYEDDKMNPILEEVKKEYNISNIHTIPSMKNSLGIIMFEVDKTITLVMSAIANFRSRFPSVPIASLDKLILYKRKLYAWDKAIQCFIYRFAEPSVNYFQNITKISREFLDTNFVKDNFVK